MQVKRSSWVPAWFRWSLAPPEASSIERRNFINVQGDGIGVGMFGGADPFLAVFLVRLGASNLQVGLLTSMPAVIGLLMAVVASRFLQRQRNVAPWYSRVRAVQGIAYALTGLVTLAVPAQHAVSVLLGIWAVVAFPQTIAAITFSMVMNAVAGTNGRYELLSRRWSVMGLTTAVTLFFAGQLLARLSYPYNYQTVFILLSSGGLISLYFSRQLVIPDIELPPPAPYMPLLLRLRSTWLDIYANSRFVSFIRMRFVFLSGIALATPIMPLYFLREAHFNEAAISFIGTAHTLALVIGYGLWARIARVKSARLLLLSTTLGLALHPLLVASTVNLGALVLLGGLAGWVQAGLDLVFFDEMMKSVPSGHPEIFLAVSQISIYVALIGAPLLGTMLANFIGLGGTLWVSAGLCSLSFLMFLGDSN